jgi:metal-responsive CopG/Arc/MetJ family transcriptional regulator
MTASLRGLNPKKEKITVSIDASLLRIVDAFVEESKRPGISRSAVFEEALRGWEQVRRDNIDTEYYSKNTAALNDPSWTEITTESARHIWKK